MENLVLNVDSRLGVCPNCGAALRDAYCSRCGQKRLDHNHLSLPAFARDAFQDIIDIEHSKILRSFSSLLIQPGKLTNEYLAGRRAQWLTPLKLYLSIFALTFFLYSICHSVAIFDLANIAAMDSTGALQRKIALLALRRGMATAVLVDEVNGKWRNYLSLAQITYPVFFAILLEVFYIRRRKAFVAHLVLALHFQSFALFVTMLFWPIYLFVGIMPTWQSLSLSATGAALVTIYLTIALRKVYQQSWMISTAKGFALYLGYYFIYSVITIFTLWLAMLAATRG